MRNFLKFSVFAICISSSAFLSAETLYYDNAVYDGEVVNGKRHGQGSIEYTSGHKYKGGWFLDTHKGKGTYTWTNGQKYVGEWLNNEHSGKGTYTQPNGRKYVGEFLNGEYSGKGRLTLSDGRKYAGEFLNGDYVGPSEKPDAVKIAPAQEYSQKINTKQSEKSASSTNLIWFLLLAILAAGSWYFFYTDRKKTEKPDLPFDEPDINAVEESKDPKPKPEDTESEEKSPIVMTLIKTVAVIPPFMLLGALIISASKGYPFDPMEVASGQLWLAFVLWPFAIGYLIWRRSSEKTSVQ